MANHLRYLLPLALLIVTSSPLHSEIGSTRDECIARYGKPERDAIKESGLLFFRKDGLCTIAHFEKGRCDVLSIFSCNEVTGLPEELGSLLLREGGGTTWQPLARFSINQVWNSTDKKSFAIYDTMRHKLVIMTRAAYSREIRARHDAQIGGKPTP